MRNHIKPLLCHLCPKGTHGNAQQKDLDRHYWTHHPVYAEEHKIPKDIKSCPWCSYQGRSDNVKRHQRTNH